MATLAQSVERQALKLAVAGSIFTGFVFEFFLSLFFDSSPAPSPTSSSSHQLPIFHQLPPAPTSQELEQQLQLQPPLYPAAPTSPLHPPAAPTTCETLHLLYLQLPVAAPTISELSFHVPRDGRGGGV